jgi:LmbE family N-acetylglucosaminyl deacetylase
MGHRVKFLSLTNGDAGHQSEGGGALAKRRRAEAEEAGRRLGIAEYEVLDNHDGELEPTLPVRGQVIRAIRSWNADLVVLPRPNDYHPDHRNTGLVVQDAAYMVIVPNVAPDTPPLSRNPVFLYCQDSFQRPNPFRPDVAVDITSVYEKKVEALDAHVSQFYEWLPWTAGKLAEVPAGKEERKRWLSATRERSIPPEVRAALERGYGAERAGQSVHAEAFEICEYGSRPGAAELRRLFPMVPGAGR